MFNFLAKYFCRPELGTLIINFKEGGVKKHMLKFKLIVVNEPVTEEIEFETLEALTAKVNELEPKPAAEEAPAAA